MRQIYRVSGWDVRKEQYETKCLVNAENMTHAIVNAYRNGFLRHDQVDTAKAEITDRKF